MKTYQKINEDYLDDYEDYLHGDCQQWVINNFRKGDIVVVIQEYDYEIDETCMAHSLLKRDGRFLDVRGFMDTMDEVLEEFDCDDSDVLYYNKLTSFEHYLDDMGIPYSKKVNEDYLDKADIQLDDVSVMDDVRTELDEWISEGKKPSFNPEVLPDGFYKVEDIDRLRQCISLSLVDFGVHCSLNWIDVTAVTNMNWLFTKSKFDGDISRWDISNVTDMQAMFYESEFTGDYGDISGWDVSSVDNMHAIFNKCPFCHDISRWNCASMIPDDLDRALKGSRLPDEFNPSVPGYAF